MTGKNFASISIVIVIAIAALYFLTRKSAASGGTLITDRGGGDVKQPDIDIGFPQIPGPSTFNTNLAFPIINAIASNVPWHNSLPSEYPQNIFNFNMMDSSGNLAPTTFGDMLLSLSFGDMIFGGSATNIDMGDVDLGTTNIDARVILPDASGCNVCSAPTEMTEPLLPYSPTLQAEEIKSVPADPPAIVNTAATGDNTVMPLMRMMNPQLSYGPNGRPNAGIRSINLPTLQQRQNYTRQFGPGHLGWL